MLARQPFHQTEMLPMLYRMRDFDRCKPRPSLDAEMQQAITLRPDDTAKILVIMSGHQTKHWRALGTMARSIRQIKRNFVNSMRASVQICIAGLSLLGLMLVI